MEVYGYIRVSTKDQNEARQVIAMQHEQVPEGNIFLDKTSGKDFKRPEYRRLLEELRRGDLLLVMSIDRLGRNYKEIMEQWRIITKEIGANISIIDMPLLNTANSSDLIGTFISDLVLQLLSFVAETERTNIHSRQKQGIEAAKARGIRFGRPLKLMPDNITEILAKWHSGAMSVREVEKLCNMSMRTIHRRYNKNELVG